MDPSTYLKWLPLLSVVVLPLAAWMIRAATASMATKEDLREQTSHLDAKVQGVSSRLGGLERRTDLMERDIKHLPTAEDFAGLKDQIAALAGAERAQTQQLSSLSQSVTRIEDFLLHKGVR
ncbi:DUF2730 family protein [Neomegalonema sp.]|uniref:DUF2730 family protein n=1 Tax=Neomegalonema sp. TaxID=2039713 RepID=UPI002637C27F|nr:DUF2730 family protein [Neomegalonema sp.]MDD2867704.1 DUF2730 family protein [Neomegalonema sp.]